jgi:hypothetical protein
MSVAAIAASALARSPQARAVMSAEHVMKWAVMTILAMALRRVGMKGGELARLVAQSVRLGNDRMDRAIDDAVISMGAAFERSTPKWH